MTLRFRIHLCGFVLPTSLRQRGTFLVFRVVRSPSETDEIQLIGGFRSAEGYSPNDVVTSK